MPSVNRENGNMRSAVLPVTVCIFLFLVIISLAHELTSTHSIGRSAINVTSSITTTLRAVVIISHHGFRNPRHTFPADPHPFNNRTEWPEGRGKLNEIGKLQMRNMGLFLRNRYQDFFHHFDVDDVLLMSNSDKRAIQSAKELLSSILSKKKKKFEAEIDDIMLNKVVEVAKSCPVLQPILQQIESETEERLENQAEFIESIVRMTGIDKTGIFASNRIADLLRDFVTANKSLPDWATPAVREKLTMIKRQSSCVLYTSPALVSLMTAPIVTDLRHRLRKIMKHPNHKGLLVHSARQERMALMMRSLGVSLNDLHVPHAASLVFELHQRIDSRIPHVVGYFVKDTGSPVKYLGTGNHPDPRVPRPFDDFFAKVQLLDREAWSQACNDETHTDRQLQDVERCFA